MLNRLALATYTATYVLAVVLANYLTAHVGHPVFPGGPHDVGIGFGLRVTTGTFAAGAALLARDFVHRRATVEFGRRRGIGFVLAVIAAAGVVSWFLSTPALAVASTVAFVGAELVDLTVFVPARDRAGFVPAALASNVVSAPVDTLLFLLIAGFPITVGIVVGQLIAKLVYATAVPLVLYVVATSPRNDPAVA